MTICHPPFSNPDFMISLLSLSRLLCFLHIAIPMFFSSVCLHFCDFLVIFSHFFLGLHPFLLKYYEKGNPIIKIPTTVKYLTIPNQDFILHSDLKHLKIDSVMKTPGQRPSGLPIGMYPPPPVLLPHTVPFPWPSFSMWTRTYSS